MIIQGSGLSNTPLTRSRLPDVSWIFFLVFYSSLFLHLPFLLSYFPRCSLHMYFWCLSTCQPHLPWFLLSVFLFVSGACHHSKAALPPSSWFSLTHMLMQIVLHCTPCTQRHTNTSALPLSCLSLIGRNCDMYL